MTEYFLRDMPTDIWKEILQRHWTYLETEDGMQKLEEKKKLIACLKEFLCIVPHDRKFFLPETAHVLKKSVKEMDNFSAYKAMIGFESISQYANNLFTKPWRKEFKVIKMYSGFYQHEIKSNLVDAEKLFKAMGYRQLPNQLLVLDGPICPDQVTNVSRDGMAAYVECKIMKNILNELDTVQLQSSWLEIFNFREIHVCGSSQAVKAMIYAIQERKFRKEKQISHENCYGNVPQQLLNNCPTCCSAQLRNCRQTIPSTSLNGINGTSNCQIHGFIAPMIQSQQDFQKYGTICGGNGMHLKPQQQQQSLLPNNIYGLPLNQTHNCNNHSGYPLSQQQQAAQMTHSKSLEHYSADGVTSSTILSNIMPPRHSFDHYDCIDGGHQNCNNYNLYNQQHPYNVSGNRYPLPYQISNQLTNQSIYGQCPVLPQQQQQQIPIQSTTTTGIINNYHNNISGNQKLLSSDLKNNGSCGGNNGIIDTNCILHHSCGNNAIANGRYMSNDIMDLYNKNNIDNNYRNNDNFLDDDINELHIKRNEKINDNNSRQLLKNNLILRGGGCYGSAGGAGSSGAINNDINDLITPIDSSNDSTTSTTPKSIQSLQNKNQDGYGSFESWNFVFQNLEKNGYTKDLGERGDLLVQGLDLDSIKLNNDKRKSREAIIQQTSNITNNINITTTITTPTTTTTPTIIQSIQTNKNNSGNNRLSKNLDNDPQIINKKMDKQLNPAMITTTKICEKSNGHISSGGKNIDKFNNSTNRTQKSSKTLKNSINNNNTNNDIDKTIMKQQKQQHEWNCRFCTYLNQGSIRICEMCSRTKDFNLDGKNP